MFLVSRINVGIHPDKEPPAGKAGQLVSIFVVLPSTNGHLRASLGLGCEHLSLSLRLPSPFPTGTAAPAGRSSFSNEAVTAGPPQPRPRLRRVVTSGGGQWSFCRLDSVWRCRWKAQEAFTLPLSSLGYLGA